MVNRGSIKIVNLLTFAQPHNARLSLNNVAHNVLIGIVFTAIRSFITTKYLNLNCGKHAKNRFIFVTSKRATRYSVC